MAEQIIGMNALQRRLNAISGPHSGERIMRTLGTAAVREQKLLVHRKTGNLGRSIHVGTVTPTSVQTIASVNYAGFVEFGTRAHEIVPRVRKALRFAASASGRRLSGAPRKGAAVVFAKRVHHPGTRPYPFMLPGAKLAVEQSGLTKIIINEWNGA